jgi:hypothetical protein
MLELAGRDIRLCSGNSDSTTAEHPTVKLNFPARCLDRRYVDELQS